MSRLLIALALSWLVSGEALSQPRVQTLHPGDGIRLRVFGGDSTLSGEFVVDERFIVVLPKLGEWNVAGMPADSIRPRLIRALGEYVLSPSIEATPFRRIAITGEVVKPGLYAIDASMSVGDAVILAMGTKDEAKQNVVELRRMGAKRGVEVPMESRVWEISVMPGEQLVVPRVSWVRRDGLTTFTAIMSVAGSLAWAISILNR